MKVGYQGIPGCYSEGALFSLFKDQVFLNHFQKFEILDTHGFATFDILLQELDEGGIDFALLPVESNLAGSFHSVLDLIAHSKVTIQGEIKYSESCCLLGTKETSDIKEIRAHYLVIGQCVKFMDSLKGCKITLAGDTAQAALDLSLENVDSVAVIGGKRAANMYGLKVLKENVQDDIVNVTRFFLVSKAGLSTNLIPRHLNPCTFVIANCKSTPGAFFRALGCFSLRDINVSKIESRASNRSLSLSRPWEYLLYIEVDGSIGSSNVLNAIENLKEYCQSVLVLGSFPRYQPLLAQDEEFSSGIGM
jgi:prephenate dehydratase